MATIFPSTRSTVARYSSSFTPLRSAVLCKCRATSVRLDKMSKFELQPVTSDFLCALYDRIGALRGS